MCCKTNLTQSSVYVVKVIKTYEMVVVEDVKAQNSNDCCGTKVFPQIHRGVNAGHEILLLSWSLDTV